MIKSVLGAAVAAVLLSASSSFAATLFDSHGFEPSADTTINYVQNYLQGQPGGADGSNKWVQAPFGVGATPYAAIYATGVGGNTQYLQVGAAAVPAANSNYFYPMTQSLSPFVPAAGQGVAVTWAMSVSSYLSALNNNAFFGVVAYGNNIANDNVQIASAGIDASTGDLIGGTNTVSAFNAADDTYYNFELLLNFATQSYAIYTAPAGAVNTSDYVLRATAPFAAAAVSFTDADIANFSLQGPAGAAYTAYGNFDNYLVQTVAVPEPTVIGLAGMALGLLTARRRRTTAV